MAEIPLTRYGPENGGNFEYSWSNGYLAAHFISDVGKKRQHNEDSCILCAPEDPQLARRGYLFAIADGMGGASAGEHASRMALHTIVEELYAGSDGNIPDHLRTSVQSANLRIFQEAESNPEYHGMGTTVSSLVVMGDCAYVGHVGDSRIYLSRGRTEMVQVTEDHSLVAEQVRCGIISEEEARNHSLKNLITRAVGIKDDVQVDLSAFKLRRGDTMLICSDGLNNMVDDEDIALSLQMEHLQGAARVLVGKALESGGTDNITVALVRVMGAPPKEPIQEGVQALPLPGDGFIGKIKRMMT